MKKRTNILISGLYGSGSSALVAFLSDYHSVAVVTNEFVEFRKPGMVGDLLDISCSDKNENVIDEYVFGQMERHISIEFSNSLRLLVKQIAARFGVLPNRFAKPIVRRLDKLSKLNVVLKSESISFEQKIQEGNNWITSVGEIYAEKKDFVIFDQPIFQGRHQDIWPAVFTPYKLIIVYRDPRDQLARLIERGKLYTDHKMNATGSIGEIYGNNREGAIKFQIEAMKARLQSSVALCQKLGPQSVAMLSFEKFIQNHEDTKQKLIEFLGLDIKRLKTENTVFKPEISAKNIGIFNSYLKDEEIELVQGVYKTYQQLEKSNPFYT